MTQFAKSPYLDLQPKPSDTPNNFPGFSLNQSQDPGSTRSAGGFGSVSQSSIKQLYESIAKPLFNVGSMLQPSS